MSKLYYKKTDKQKRRQIVRYLGLMIFVFGSLYLLYFSFPVVLWQLYSAPVYASEGITTPIPRTVVLNKDNIKSLLLASANALAGVDYTNAQNWYPAYHPSTPKEQPKVPFYFLSIPKLKIYNATVSTVDYDLAAHLVNYGGTAIPPEKGNAVVFGHSTLPQLYNPRDYKTIFANLHTIKIGDTIVITRENTALTYRIFDIQIVDPDNLTPLTQEYDDSYLTIITCTPPGTIWKRLVVKARLEKT